MKHENNYFTRIFLIFFVGKKKGHIFAPSKMTLSMIVPLCNGSTAGFGSVSPGSNPILGTNSIKVYDFRL